MTAAALLIYGTPIMVLVCVIAAIQQQAARKPPRNDAHARFREFWGRSMPLAQFGIWVGPDGFVYANATSRCLGHAGGAKATVVPCQPVGRVRPSTGWCVITFADGTVHRHLYGLRDRAEAAAQMARFNGLAIDPAQVSFRRTWTP